MKYLCCAAALLCFAWTGCSSPAPKEKAPAKQVEKAGPAPAHYRVKFVTTKGDFTVDVNRASAPYGADRFHELVQAKYFDEARFFRVVRRFVVQFGINGDPSVNQLWRQLAMVDDPVKGSNKRGTLTFAMSGPNSRTTQVFINLANNRDLDKQGFAPFGTVVEGMDVVDQLYAGYGDMPPRGNGPDPSKLQTQGNEYLTNHFERLDSIKTARVMP